jgi:hypothetical protein|tara:strand:- start:228 stop:551 length:324 start_codon:yes stop_codon:yes gene_type:complete
MNYEESIKYIKNNSYSAYEIHKATGLNEASLRKILRGEVKKSQRRTKDTIIAYVDELINSNGLPRFVDLEELIPRIIENHDSLLLNQNYATWFELQVYKKAFELTKK